MDDCPQPPALQVLQWPRRLALAHAVSGTSLSIEADASDDKFGPIVDFDRQVNFLERLSLPGTDLKVPRFIFGTAGLFNAGSRTERVRLLDAAFDHGLTHFDTAPYYGFGMAERDLATSLARRPNARVTTKVGLYSPGGEEQAAAAILLRKVAGRILPFLSRPSHDWSVARAKQSLEGSLRRLGRDHIDLYLLHEPQLRNLATDEFLRWLSDERAAGRVGHFGLAGAAPEIKPFLEAKSSLASIIQTTDSVDLREADMLSDYDRPFQSTYGYVSSAKRRMPGTDAVTILKRALERNRRGAIIVTTNKIERLIQYGSLAAGEAG